MHAYNPEMCACIQAYTHTILHAYIHMTYMYYMHTYQTELDEWLSKHVTNNNAHTYVHTIKHMCVVSYCLRKSPNTTHIYVHTYTHTYIQAHTLNGGVTF